VAGDLDSLTNVDPGSRRQPLHQAQQVGAAERHATRGWPKAVAGNMDENGAAAPRDPRSVVVVDLNDQVVETIVPHEPVSGFSRRAPDREAGPGPGQAVGPPPKSLEAESAEGSPAVPLEFVGDNARTAQSDRKSGISSPQNASGLGSRPFSDVDMDEGPVRHGLLEGFNCAYQ
jgi:hypothetical protein